MNGPQLTLLPPVTSHRYPFAQDTRFWDYMLGGLMVTRGYVFLFRVFFTFGSVVRWLLLTGNFYDVFSVVFCFETFGGVFRGVRSLVSITITSFHV